jgi:flagellin-like hook-associated protein FlgL
MIRIGSNASQAQLLSLIRDIQTRFATHQFQAASGKKSATFSGLGAALPQRLNLEDARSKVSRYVDNIDLVETRIKLADLNIEGMEKIAHDMRGILESLPYDHAQMAALAKNYLAAFADHLNQENATRSLFGGTNVAGPAVQIFEPGTADPAVPFFGVPGGNSYRYKIMATGTPDDTAVKIGDNLSVPTAFTANTPAVNAFTKTMDALIALADFNTPTNPTPTQADVDAAKAQLASALAGDTAAGYLGFDNMRAQLGKLLHTALKVKESHQQFLNYAVDAIASTEAVDLAKVAAELNADRVALEASYAVLARLNELSLLDHLR